MAIGARDRIDAMLVKKYAMAKVDNPIVQSSMIDPNKMYEAMNDYAQAHMSMIRIREQLKETCIKAVAQNIKYTKTRNIKMAKPKGLVKPPAAAAAM